MTKAQEIKAKALLNKLNFDDCIKLFESLPFGSEIEEMVLNKMEQLDSKKIY